MHTFWLVNAKRAGAVKDGICCLVASEQAQGTPAHAFRLTLVVRLALLVSAGGQTESAGSESPASPNGNRLRRAEAGSTTSNSNSTSVKLRCLMLPAPHLRSSPKAGDASSSLHTEAMPPWWYVAQKRYNVIRLKERNAQLFSVILIFKNPHYYFGGGEGWRVRGLGRCGEMVHSALMLSLTSK